MLTFEKAMELTRTVSSNTAFEDDECKLYFDLLLCIPKHGLAVEVGLEYGRSSSIALQVAQDVGFDYIGIDTFEGNPDAQKSWAKMAEPFAKFVYVQKSVTVSGIGSIDAILIDGDHSFQGVLDDCNHFEPMMAEGAFMMFHDYGRESLPEVQRAVDMFFLHRKGWFHYAHFGTLKVFRKI